MIKQRQWQRIFVPGIRGLFSLGVLFTFVRAEAIPTPPQQPSSGPGGKEVAHAGLIASHHGSGSLAYWIFEPAQPAPEGAPLIVFNHGWSALDPRVYQAWIDHIVRRGNIVVFPVYQTDLFTPVPEFTSNAIVAVYAAIALLQNEPGHVKPDLDKFAIVGHSMGGNISANMAALWKMEGLPHPRAVMSVEPGKTWGKPEWAVMQSADLSQIPADTLLLAVAGDADHVVRDIDAKRIFNESTQVPLTNKDYITLVSDEHGLPPLIADHLAPVAWALMPDGTPMARTGPDGPLMALLAQRIQSPTGNTNAMSASETDSNVLNLTVDALDFYGTWKLFDALTDAAFYGKNKNYALGDTPEQRFMGTWSDGAPAKEMIVTDHP